MAPLRIDLMPNGLAAAVAERLAVADELRAHPSGEQDLLGRLRTRDGAALEKIALEYGAPLSRAAYLYLGDGHEAADVAQDVLIAAWDGAGRTTEKTPLRAWLFGILFHICRKRRRTFARRRRREEKAAERRPSFLAAPWEGVEAEERLEALRAALGTLDGPMREVILLRYEQGMSVLETARALDIPEGTVKSRTHKAIATLRGRLERKQA